jgi:hypothetical protein
MAYAHYLPVLASWVLERKSASMNL